VGENVNATKSRHTSEKNDSEKIVIKKETNSFYPSPCARFFFPTAVTLFIYHKIAWATLNKFFAAFNNDDLDDK
jgi:hypothetical protein